jgi:hypothetical protein
MYWQKLPASLAQISATGGKGVHCTQYMYITLYKHLAGSFWVLWQNLQQVAPNQEKPHTTPLHSLIYSIYISVYLPHWGALWSTGIVYSGDVGETPPVGQVGRVNQAPPVSHQRFFLRVEGIVSRDEYFFWRLIIINRYRYFLHVRW